MVLPYLLHVCTCKSKRCAVDIQILFPYALDYNKNDVLKIPMIIHAMLLLIWSLASDPETRRSQFPKTSRERPLSNTRTPKRTRNRQFPSTTRESDYLLLGTPRERLSMAHRNASQLTSDQKDELKAKLKAIYKPLEQHSFQAEYERRQPMDCTKGERDVLVVTSEDTKDCLQEIIQEVKEKFGPQVWKGTFINDSKGGRMEMWVVAMTPKPAEGSVMTYSVKEIEIITDFEKKKNYVALVNIYT